MCILVLAINQHPNYPLLLFHNRDENLEREFLDMDYENFKEHGIIAAKDKKSGGTWFGVNYRNGRYAVICDFRSNEYPPIDKNKVRSKGLLVLEYLKGYMSTEEIVTTENEYNGFTIVHGNIYYTGRAMVSTNRFSENKEDPLANRKIHTKVVAKGMYALSNRYFDDESWPKVKAVKEGLGKILKDFNGSERELIQKMSTLMTNSESLPGVPEDLSYSPLSKEKETANHKIFIEHNYGKPKAPLEYSGTSSQGILVTSLIDKQTRVYYRSTLNYPDIPDWTIFQ